MNIPLAESALAAPHASFDGTDFYPDLATKGAILCSRIIRNHPLPDGNKRLGLSTMRVFLARNGLIWTPPPGGVDETVAVVEALAGRIITEPDFVTWVTARVT